MDAITAYRYRRKQRLDARGVKPKNTKRFSDPSVVEIYKKRMDADDIDWISTETGTHIPLIDGKAVGGPLKGREFKDAKASTSKGSGSVNTKRRGQIDTGHDGMIHQADLPEYNKKALESIMEETGYSEIEARKFQSSMLDYLGGDYAEYTRGGKKKEVEVIDQGLARMPKYDGETYRGMNFNHGIADFKKFEGLEIGDEIGMKSVSSWSSKEGVATKYGCLSTSELDSVMITCKKNNSGVGVQHISKWGKLESEVLAPSTAKWKVTGKKVVTKYEYLKEHYSKLLENDTWERRRKLWQIALKENEENKDAHSKHKVVFLEVEEI